MKEWFDIVFISICHFGFFLMLAQCATSIRGRTSTQIKKYGLRVLIWAEVRPLIDVDLQFICLKKQQSKFFTKNVVNAIY